MLTRSEQGSLIYLFMDITVIIASMERCWGVLGCCISSSTSVPADDQDPIDRRHGAAKPRRPGAYVPL